VKFTFLKRPKAGVTTWLGGVMPKAGAALMLGMLAMVISPATAQAEKWEARMCLHIPQGHNFDSDGGFMVVVRQNAPGESAAEIQNFAKLAVGTGDVQLGLNMDSNVDLSSVVSVTSAINGINKTLKVGYTCKVFPLGVYGENYIKNFPLETHTYIDAALIGLNDLCANELYIQKIKDGVLQTTASFITENQLCWGDDFHKSKMIHSLDSMPTDQRKLTIMTFKSAEGRWENVCRNDNCDKTDTFTISQSVKTGETLTNSSSETVKKEVSAGLEYSGFSAGASMSKETTTSVSKSVSTDITKGEVTSTTVKLEYTPSIRNSFGVLSVWEFMIYTTMSDGSVIAVRAGYRGCSDSNNKPAFGPGSPDIDQSCQGALNASDCAFENEECTFSVNGQYRVFFGMPGNTVSKVADTSITCDIASFGKDPLPGVYKRCWGYPVIKK
jgi:hypothetical protein